MTSSIGGLIEEQRQRQRLENEITIAREVQAQLFPRTIPQLPGRGVGGDLPRGADGQRRLLRFHSAQPSESGDRARGHQRKGNFRSALDGQPAGGVAKLGVARCRARARRETVARLNLHLCRNTVGRSLRDAFLCDLRFGSPDARIYECGPLRPVSRLRENVKKLEEGGTVVGLFEEAEYESVTVPAPSRKRFRNIQRRIDGAGERVRRAIRIAAIARGSVAASRCCARKDCAKN